jgi:hypothetical protein
VSFEFLSGWLEGAPAVDLTALYLQRAGTVETAVLQGRPATSGLAAGAQFDAWVKNHRLFVARAGRPLPLYPLDIPKPWGRELWFTAAEQRGVCEFGDIDARTPQPWLLSALPEESEGSAYRALPLLKILDPLAQPVVGELYFELHEVKREVYIVTNVDRQAWPDGVGYLRFGFCPERLGASSSEAAFRREYLSAVRDYRCVREQIDALPEGVGPEPELSQHEARLRATMNAFTRLKPVRVGDVIEVPCLLPHALQHGVRVVEFQTPVFERKILSFAQRVLTQTDWDTEHAIRDMRLLPPPGNGVLTLHDEGGARVERIADMPGFEVRRLQVEPGGELSVAVANRYALAMVLQGGISLPDCDLGPEQAAWLPRGWQAELTVPEGSPRLVLLIALVQT